MSRDPLEREYPNISTYAFAGGSPIYIMDADGRKLYVFATRKNWMQSYALFKQIWEEGLGGKVKVHISKKGKVTYSMTEAFDQSRGFTKEEQAAFDVLHQVVTSEEITRVHLRSNDDSDRLKGLYDNYSLSMIDLSDIMMLGVVSGQKTRIGVMVHAIVEQRYGQHIQDDYTLAHNEAIKQENLVSNINRPLAPIPYDPKAASDAHAIDVAASGFLFTEIGNGNAQMTEVANNNG
jgi:hypothetical protein